MTVSAEYINVLLYILLKQYILYHDGKTLASLSIALPGEKDRLDKGQDHHHDKDVKYDQYGTAGNTQQEVSVSAEQKVPADPQIVKSRKDAAQKNKQHDHPLRPKRSAAFSLNG